MNMAPSMNWMEAFRWVIKEQRGRAKRLFETQKEEGNNPKGKEREKNQETHQVSKMAEGI